MKQLKQKQSNDRRNDMLPELDWTKCQCIKLYTKCPACIKEERNALREEVRELKEKATVTHVTHTWTPEQFDRLVEKLIALLMKSKEHTIEEFYMTSEISEEDSEYEFGAKFKK